MNTVRDFSNSDGVKVAVSIEEGANLVGLSRTSFLKEVYAGNIPSKLVGKRRIIPMVGLRQWVVEGTGIRPMVQELLSDTELDKARDLEVRKAFSASVSQETLDEIRYGGTS